MGSKSSKQTERETKLDLKENHLCPICFSSYDNTQSNMQIFQCRHKVCSLCYNHLLNTKYPQCPLLRGWHSQIDLNYSPLMKFNENQKNPVSHIFKIVIIGNAGVGKSSLLNRYIDVSCDEGQCTIGVIIQKKRLVLNGVQIRAEIWDTGGSERFMSMPSLYYKDCDGAILCYDICDQSSFDYIDQWRYQIQEYGGKDCQIIVVGCKSDLDYKRQVQVDKIRNFANSKGYQFLETSSKSNINVKLVYELLCLQILQTKEK